MTRQQILANAVLESRMLIARYFNGFDESNHTKQAANLPNHFAWTLGHPAHIVNRAAGLFDGRGLPESDFVSGDGSAGTSTRFDTESIAFGSRPVDDAGLYPTHERCITVFDDAIQRLVSAIRRVDEPKLDSTVAWGKTQVKLWALVIRIVFHNGTHCGQLADLRRALKMPSIFA